MVNKTTKVLGELEAEIMETVWKFKNVSVRDVFDKLKKHRIVAYTTVMTIMGRLVNKGILKRKLDGSGAYIYTSSRSKEEFLAISSRRLIKSLINNFGEMAIAQFIGVIEDSNLKDLAKWQKKLKQIK